MAPSFDHLRAAITTGHTRAFGKDNLITQKITPKESDTWNEIIMAAGTFINTNYPQLNNDFNEIQEISDDVINTLKINYWANIAPCARGLNNKEHGITLNTAWIRNTKVHKREISKVITQVKWNFLNLQQIDQYLCNRFKSHLDRIEKIMSILDTRHGRLDLKEFPTQQHQQAIYILKYVALGLNATITSSITLHLNTLKLFSYLYPTFEPAKRRAHSLRRTKETL